MSLRSVWRVARWEAIGGGGGIDRRALGLAALAVVLLAVSVPIAASVGPAPESGLYRVGIAADSPYRAPAVASGQFAVLPPDEAAFEAGRLDLLVRDDGIRIADTRTGRAAAAALREATTRYNDRRMREESDRAAAFPVHVDLRYVERDVGSIARPGRSDGRAGGGTGDAGDGRDGGQPDADTGTPSATAARETSGQPGLSLRGTALLPHGTSGTPASIAPPFPFGSLVLAFAFVVPMNFVVQAYASSVLHDRGNRRGEPLLVVPVSKWALIAGKALPYLALMLAIAGGTAVVVGGGLVSLVAVVPIALLFLAGGFIGGMLARSHKELTFVLVAVSVGLTSYAFVPAIFADVHPIAAISPLSLVVHDLQGTGVAPATVAFSTGPACLAAVLMYGLGGGLYREEDLFTQRPLPEKALDALAAFVTSPRRAGWASLLSVPFVFLAELLAIALLFALPLGLALSALFVLIATIEELAKSLPAYAGFERGRYGGSALTAVRVGAYSGLGFFLGEKLAVVAQVVGLFDLDLGRFALELGAGIGGSASPVPLAVLLLAPLGLHAATAMLSAFGASRGGRAYLLALVGAIGIHTAYNLGVVVHLA